MIKCIKCDGEDFRKGYEKNGKTALICINCLHGKIVKTSLITNKLNLIKENQ